LHGRRTNGYNGYCVVSERTNYISEEHNKIKMIMFLESKVGLVRRADILTGISEPIVLDNVGSVTPHNPIGLQGLLRG
jgi:hypothetical protein